VATDNYNGGRLAGLHLLELLAAEGKTEPRIIMMRYQVGSESTDQREQGFEDVINQYIKEHGLDPAKVWLSSDKYAGATKESALKEAGPLVNKYRAQIDGIFAVNESSAAGMLDALRSLGLSQRVQRLDSRPPSAALHQAVADGLVGAEILTGGAAEARTELLGDAGRLQQLGLRKQVRLMGFDSSQPLLQAVESGEIDGLILQDPYRMGYLGLWTVVRYLEGDNVDADGNYLGTGEHVITRGNLKSRSTIELFDPQAQAERVIAVPKWPKRARP